MKIAFGCDPNAAELKNKLLAFAESLGHECADCGSEDAIYANVAIKVATEVASGQYDRGILICGTGIGMSITANKVPGAYCALVSNIYQAQRAQLSNNANVMALGAFVTGTELAKCFVQAYLERSFDPASSSAPKVARIAEYERTGT